MPIEHGDVRPARSARPRSAAWWRRRRAPRASPRPACHAANALHAARRPRAPAGDPDQPRQQRGEVHRRAAGDDQRRPAWTEDGDEPPALRGHRHRHRHLAGGAGAHLRAASLRPTRRSSTGLAGPDWGWRSSSSSPRRSAAHRRDSARGDGSTFWLELGFEACEPRKRDARDLHVVVLSADRAIPPAIERALKRPA